MLTWPLVILMSISLETRIDWFQVMHLILKQLPYSPQDWINIFVYIFISDITSPYREYIWVLMTVQYYIYIVSWFFARNPTNMKNVIMSAKGLTVR
jgi:hypothetical protein